MDAQAQFREPGIRNHRPANLTKSRYPHRMIAIGSACPDLGLATAIASSSLNPIMPAIPVRRRVI